MNTPKFKSKNWGKVQKVRNLSWMKMVLVRNKSNDIDLIHTKLPKEIRDIIDDKEIVIPENSFSDPLLRFP